MYNSENIYILKFGIGNLHVLKIQDKKIYFLKHPHTATFLSLFAISHLENTSHLSHKHEKNKLKQQHVTVSSLVSPVTLCNWQTQLTINVTNIATSFVCQLALPYADCFKYLFLGLNFVWCCLLVLWDICYCKWIVMFCK